VSLATALTAACRERVTRYARTMALLLIPFFMPLLLLGWVLTTPEERAQQLLDMQRERQVAESWGVLFGRESAVMICDDIKHPEVLDW
jgi:hypothetical protein